MIKLKLHTIKVNGKQFGYWSNVVKSPRRTCLLLSPGAYSGKFFKNYEKYFSDRDLFICPDFPARGFSEPQDQNSISSIAKTIDKFIRELGLNNIYLAGFSYGTQISTELLKINEKRFKKVMLIASGEFFGSLTRFIFKLIFAPFLFLDVLRHKVRKYVLKYIYVPNKNLKEINLQWISTLNYKIPKNLTIKTPTIFVDFGKDQYVTKTSKNKIKKIFINSKTINIDEIHPSNIINFDRLFNNFWKKIYE